MKQLFGILMGITLASMAVSGLVAQEKSHGLGLGLEVAATYKDEGEFISWGEIALPFLRNDMDTSGWALRPSVSYRYEIVQGFTLGARLAVGLFSMPFPLPDLNPYLTSSWRLSEGLRLGLEVGPTQLGLGLELADTWYVSLHPGWGLSLLEPGIAVHYLFRF